MKLRSAFRSLIFAHLALSGLLPVARGFDPQCVTDLLTPLVNPLKKSLTTPEERKLIESWFRDPAMPFEQASQASFDLVLRKRLELLPPELRQQIPFSTSSERARKDGRRGDAHEAFLRP